MAEIQIKNVQKTFGAYTALHDINLTIAASTQRVSFEVERRLCAA